MNTKIGKTLNVLLIALLITGALAIFTPKAKANGTTVTRIIPSPQTFGPGDCIGTHFTVNFEIFNVTDLYGFDIQIGWNTTWIRYVTHTKMIPVNTHPGGILYQPTSPVTDQVDETASMPGSEPGTMYWLSEASKAPAASFNGTGYAFTMEFIIIAQPMEPEPDVTTYIIITGCTLACRGPPVAPIDHTEEPCEIIIHAKPFVYPAEPLLKVVPETVSGVKMCNNFTSYIYLAAWDETSHSIVNLDGFWDVAGFDIIYNFDPTLIEAVNVTVDPDGWFAAFWPNHIYIVKEDINNTAGTVWIAFLGLPGAGGVHTAPYGQHNIVSVKFHSIYDSETFPPPSCVLGLDPVTVAGFPHPERDMLPWNGSSTAVPLDHFIQNGTYTSFFKPPGAWIDVYTQYPGGFNGEGPNEPSDMFWPQKRVQLFAYVTYNFWPEQQKDVAFEVIDPHGTIWAIICNRTGTDGIAWVYVRLPWPCDDPEYYFGVWHVIATVDVACTVVNDTLDFKYDYHVRVWKTTLDTDSYKHLDTIEVTIEYGTVSMQTFAALFTITAVDETGVPFDFTWTWDSVGGAQYCTYANGTFKLYLHIPKFARAGLATIYVQVLHNWPSAGGDSIYPTKEPETIVHFGIEAA
jgi:hypothetical protein